MLRSATLGGTLGVVACWVLAVAGSVVCASSVSKSRQLRVENPTQQLVHMSKSMVALCTLFVLHLSDRFPETQTTHRQTRWGNCYLGKPIAAEAPLGWRHWSRAKLKRSFHKLIQHNWSKQSQEGLSCRHNFSPVNFEARCQKHDNVFCVICAH